MKNFLRKGAVCACLFLLSFNVFAQITVSTASGLPNYSINAMAYGNGVYIAVGYYNTIVKSTDGINWTVVQSTAAVNPIFQDVIFANGKFVAIMQNGSIYTSTDGDNWTAQTSGTTNFLSKICYGNGKFIAVGNAGTAISSPDGVTWTAINTGTSSADDFISGVYDGSKFVFGLRSSGNGVYLRHSTTGNSGSWSSVTVNTSAGINDIYYVGGIYYIFTVTIDPNNAIFKSTNGTSWSPVINSAITYPNQMFHASYDGSKYYLYGSTTATGYGSVFSSTDGNSFTQQAQSTTITCQNVAYLNGKYFQMGNEGITYSTDGVNWLPAGATHNGIATNGSRYVAVGQFSSNQASFYTASGWNYLTPVAAPITKPMNAVIWGGSKFVAVGNTNSASSNHSVFATSPDGITWTTGHTGFTDVLRGVAYGNNKYVAVGLNGRILYSADGSSWSSAESVTGYNYYSVAFINNRFIAVGGSTTATTGMVKVKYSSDGITWTDASPGIVGHFHGIAYDGTRYVLVGRDNVSATLKFFSVTATDITNTSTYTAAVTATTPEGDVGTAGYGGISYNNGKFTAIVNLKATPFSAYILTSSNGSSWTAIPANTTGRLRAITADGSGFRASGSLTTRLTVSNGNILPVKLQSFTAVAIGKTVQLQWNVAEQYGIKGYEIQRSADGVNYISLTAVNSKPGAEAAYNYTDASPLGRNYYRIKIIEQDETAKYSKVQLVTISQKGEIKLSPNPVTANLVMVRYNSESNKKINYTVYNILGAAVQKGSLQNGFNTLDLSGLKAGKYVLQTENGISEMLEKL